MTVDEQLSRVVAKLEPVREALRRLAAEPDVTMRFYVVRILDTEDGEEEDMSPIHGRVRQAPLSGRRASTREDKLGTDLRVPSVSAPG